MTPYAPGTAVKEYQDRLAIQKAADQLAQETAPEFSVATYVLTERVPDFNNVLNMGAGKGGLAVYSTQHLRDAKGWLVNPVGHKPHGGAYFTVGEQLDRIGEQLENRSQTIGQQVSREFELFNL